MTQNLLDTLVDVLSNDNRFVIDGKLAKNAVIEKGLSLDNQLLSHLISHPDLKRHFFQETPTALVFDKVKFMRFVSNKQFLKDSYTAFSNSIGLTASEVFISESKEVVLSYPYKDCVLEGGQTKEDQSKEEIFWNYVLAPDDIDRLFAPKAFDNIKVIDESGEHIAADITGKENLLIKGNNLLALHSLKQTYQGKVKLIYIDPPYNTESDSFRYNDAFNQSTWLTFIKNRVEVAYDLLADDGFFFVHISFHQYAYLKVLMDEIFKGNHVCTFNLLVRHPNRILKGDKDFHDVIEYLLVYTKNKVENKIAKIKVQTDVDNYVYSVIEKRKGQTIQLNGSEVDVLLPDDYEVVKSEPSVDNLQMISIRGSLKEGNSSGRFYEKHIAPIKDKYPPLTLFKVGDMGNDKFDHRYFYTPNRGKSNGGYFQGVPLNNKDVKLVPYPNFLDFVKEFNNVGYEGQVQFRNGKKPEALIYKVFQIGNVKAGDIVMDFFVGSGTTCAVAHKLGLRYIGIEQLDYGGDDSVKRLEAVITGEQEGISQEVGWQGGGSFLYLELAKYNQAVVNRINELQSLQAFWSLMQSLSEDNRLSYKLDFSKLISQKEAVKQFSLEDLKKLALESLDHNLLYVNYSEIEDADYKLPKEIIKLNHQFYQRR